MGTTGTLRHSPPSVVPVICLTSQLVPSLLVLLPLLMSINFTTVVVLDVQVLIAVAVLVVPHPLVPTTLEHHNRRSTVLLVILEPLLVHFLAVLHQLVHGLVVPSLANTDSSNHTHFLMSLVPVTMVLA